jgi:hypothetical protein
MNRILAFVAALTLAVGVASAEPMPGADVEALLKGNTFGITYEGGEGSITWHDDLTITMSLKQPDGTTAKDSGTYRFDGKGYCSAWEALAQRTEERCFTIVKTGDSTYDIVNPDGSIDSKMTAK